MDFQESNQRNPTIAFFTDGPYGVPTRTDS